MSSLTLAEFTALIEDGLPEISLARAAVLDSRAHVELAKELPELGVSVERQQVFTDDGSVVLQNSIAVGWSLDLSGRRGLRIEAAEAGVRAVRLRADRAGANIAIDATAIYLEAARARLRLESLEQSRQPLATLTESLTRRAAEGDVSGADVARFTLALSEHDDRIAEAKAGASVAEQRLAALLGRSGRVEAADDLTIPQSPEKAKPEKAKGEKNSVRPDLQATDEDLAGGRALVRAASRWWVPTFEVSVGYLSTDFGPGTGAGANVANGYLASLSLSVPIFSRGHAERKRGEAQIARAQATKAVLERRVRSEVDVARTLLVSRIERARTHFEKRLVLVAELVKKTESAYAGGEASALELRDAYEKSADARLQAVELRFEVRMADLKLQRARGTKAAAR